MARISIEDLSFSYPGTSQKALDDISLTVESGELITLMGATGSGKSTLLRLLKPELRRGGSVSGRILIDGKDISTLGAADSARRIGYVAQSPEEQIVTDKVWHELAFTLENLNADHDRIARRVAETSSYFDIDGWYFHDTATLSGGQKQLLNLASVMTADPDILLLDEPTSQLDPVSAARFIETVSRLNRETGLTVIICEHRAEELFSISDRVMFLENGRLFCSERPREAAARIASAGKYKAYLPTAARLYQEAGGTGDIPLSVREGQSFIEGFDNRIRSLSSAPLKSAGEALSLRNVCFRYERDGSDVLRDLSMTVNKGEIFALLGSNGAGKSTAAAVAAGLRKPYSGRVRLFGRRLKDYKNGSLYRGNISLLPQDAESVFIHETVREELKGCEKVLEKLPYDLKHLFDRHPYDISGGERQLVALCKALSTDPRLLIADEPSKGLDADMKRLLSDVFCGLRDDGVTVLLITHDVEFAALCADRCALFAQGQIAAVDFTESFMSGNRFYTTAASRITRRRYDGAYTAERAAELIRQNGGAG